MRQSCVSKCWLEFDDPKGENVQILDIVTLNRKKGV